MTEEILKMFLTKSRISPKDQAKPQNDLDDPFTELISNMEMLASLGVDEIPEKPTLEESANFDDTVAATDPILSDESILVIVREVEEPVEVESGEEDGDNAIEVHDKCLEKPTSIELRSAIETLMDFHGIRRDAKLQEENFGRDKKWISKNLKEASIKDYFG